MNVSYFHRSILIGRTVSWCGFPNICNKSLEYSLKCHKSPLITLRRSLSSKLSVQNQETIYVGPMWKRILAIKILTLGTTLISVPIQIYVLKTNEQVQESIGYKILISTCIAFQTLMPLLIHWVAKRYVIKLYHNPITDKYTMETYRFFPVKKYTTFRSSESRAPNVEVFATAVIKKTYPVFFDPKYFTDIHHYKRLLGYDKPFTLPDDEDVEEISEKTKETKSREGTS